MVLNARDAEARGARILTRTKVVSADRGAEHVAGHGGPRGRRGARRSRARALVNAGGPWVEEVVRGTLRVNSSEGVRLVRGSHIVTRKLYDHDKCYFFQGEDGRIIFAIPYEQDFTLIGTTDQDHHGPAAEAGLHRRRAGLSLRLRLAAISSKPVTRGRHRLDLFRRAPALRRRGEVGHGRDARLCAESSMTTGAPLLNVFGGKITTYRRLAESALEKLAPFFPAAARRLDGGRGAAGRRFSGRTACRR